MKFNEFYQHLVIMVLFGNVDTRKLKFSDLPSFCKTNSYMALKQMLIRAIQKDKLPSPILSGIDTYEQSPRIYAINF